LIPQDHPSRHEPRKRQESRVWADEVASEFRSPTGEDLFERATSSARDRLCADAEAR
jgi:hypothetical protein